MPRPPIRTDFQREIDGVTYRATMEYDRRADWVTVSCEWGSKSARAGPSGRDVIANILLAEIIGAAKPGRNSPR